MGKKQHALSVDERMFLEERYRTEALADINAAARASSTAPPPSAKAVLDEVQFRAHTVAAYARYRLKVTDIKDERIFFAANALFVFANDVRQKAIAAQSDASLLHDLAIHGLQPEHLEPIAAFDTAALESLHADAQRLRLDRGASLDASRPVPALARIVDLFEDDGPLAPLRESHTCVALLWQFHTIFHEFSVIAAASATSPVGYWLTKTSKLAYHEPGHGSRLPTAKPAATSRSKGKQAAASRLRDENASAGESTASEGADDAASSGSGRDSPTPRRRAPVAKRVRGGGSSTAWSERDADALQQLLRGQQQLLRLLRAEKSTARAQARLPGNATSSALLQSMRTLAACAGVVEGAGYIYIWRRVGGDSAQHDEPHGGNRLCIGRGDNDGADDDTRDGLLPASLVAHASRWPDSVAVLVVACALPRRLERALCSWIAGHQQQPRQERCDSWFSLDGADLEELKTFAVAKGAQIDTEIVDSVQERRRARQGTE